MKDFTIKLPNGKDVQVFDLTQEAIEYAINYGLRQSMNDATAGVAKEMDGKGFSSDEISDELNRLRTERFDAIMSGDISTRSGGPRLRGIDQFIRIIADEEIKAAAGKLKVKLPKGPDYATMRDKYIVKHDERLRELAQARMDALSADTSDAGSLLEGII